ncbi:MAG: methyltransferase, partial [Planctomycetaceae bacterium]|nr:methyltransferase [Planctomycetaceae bacterium]
PSITPLKEQPLGRVPLVVPRNASDRLLLENADDILPGPALLVLINGTSLSRHLIYARRDVNWTVFTCEHFYLTAVVRTLEQDDELSETDIRLFCTPDLPNGPYATVILATDSRGSSELTRDLLQSIAACLQPDGRLLISTNNPKDHWLHQLLKETYGRITVRKASDGVCYIARRRDKPGKQKSYDAEFAFRDGERLIRCASRPGVFSHRRVDPGARALVRSLDLLNESCDRFDPLRPQKIVEMGCGCGAVATAAALRYPEAQVLAVDSHARAVQSTERTAALNEAANLSVLLTSDGGIPEPGTWDLFLCNPPYYSDYRISELFLLSAEEALRRGGRVGLVTKLTDWHENRMIEIFANAKVHSFGEYNVIVSVKRNS